MFSPRKCMYETARSTSWSSDRVVRLVRRWRDKLRRINNETRCSDASNVRIGSLTFSPYRCSAWAASHALVTFYFLILFSNIASSKSSFRGPNTRVFPRPQASCDEAMQTSLLHGAATITEQCPDRETTPTCQSDGLLWLRSPHLHIRST